MFKCQGIFRKLPEKQEYGDKKEKKSLSGFFFFFFLFCHAYNFELCPENGFKKKLPKGLRHEMKGKKPQTLAG